MSCSNSDVRMTSHAKTDGGKAGYRYPMTGQWRVESGTVSRMCGSVSLGSVVSLAVSVVSRIRAPGSSAALLEAHPLTTMLISPPRISALISSLIRRSLSYLAFTEPATRRSLGVERSSDSRSKDLECMGFRGIPPRNLKCSCGRRRPATRAAAPRSSQSRSARLFAVCQALSQTPAGTSGYSSANSGLSMVRRCSTTVEPQRLQAAYISKHRYMLRSDRSHFGTTLDHWPRHPYCASVARPRGVDGADSWLGSGEASTSTGVIGWYSVRNSWFMAGAGPLDCLGSIWSGGEQARVINM